MPQARQNQLDALLRHVDTDASFQTLEILKENEWERTEKVRDAHGSIFIRKYLIDEEGFGEQYRDLVNRHNPALATVFSSYDVPGYRVVIMEYCEGPTLRQWVQDNGPATPTQARAIVSDLCFGLSFLHSLTPPLIHRDIKPDNVIMTTTGVKLIDFGIARRFDLEKSADTKTWGTIGYAAPEQLGFGQSDNRTDIYALGMVLYFLLTGSDPQSDIRRTLDKDTRIDANLIEIIRRCIEMDTEKRYTTVESLREDLIVPTSKRKSDGLCPDRTSIRHQLWIVWQGIGVIVMLALAASSAFVAAETFSYASTKDALLYSWTILSLNLFFFIPLCCFATNLGGWMTRWKFLDRLRLVKLAGIIGICLALLIVNAGIAASLGSDEFETQRIAHYQK